MSSNTDGDINGLLLPGERLDDLMRNNYYIIQNPEKFCFGMDAVLLSGFAHIKKGERVLDMGTGTGILPILLEAKTPGGHFTGLELQPESADMARRSVLINNIQERIDIVCGDIKDAAGIFGASSYDVIVSNPPYMSAHHGLVNPESPKAIARHEVACTLDDVIGQGAKVLKPGGRFYMVHRPFRLVEIYACFTKYGLEPKRTRLVYPYVDKEPSMVLIEAVRGGRPRLAMEKPLIIYDSPGEYTEEIIRDYGF